MGGGGAPKHSPFFICGPPAPTQADRYAHRRTVYRESAVTVIVGLCTTPKRPNFYIWCSSEKLSDNGKANTLDFAFIDADKKLYPGTL